MLGTNLRVIHGLPEGEARAIMPLRVDVCKNWHKERGRLSLWDQLPSTGLTELKEISQKSSYHSSYQILWKHSQNYSILLDKSVNSEISGHALSLFVMGLPAQGLEERGYLPSPSLGNAGESGLDPHYLLYKKKEKQKINRCIRTESSLCNSVNLTRKRLHLARLTWHDNPITLSWKNITWHNRLIMSTSWPINKNLMMFLPLWLYVF